MRSLPLAALAALLSLAASLALAGVRLGVLAGGLPGCSAEGGCGALTSGAWGYFPGSQWPWSFIGVAWFSALVTGFVTVSARKLTVSRDAASTTSAAPRWLVAAVRVGALGSVGFLGLMLALGAFCLWCTLAHAGSVAAWLATEPPSARTSSVDATSRRGLVAAALIAIGVSGLLGVADARHRDDLVRSQRATEADMAAAARANTRQPDGQTSATNSSTEKPTDAAPTPPHVQPATDVSTPHPIDRLAGHLVLGAKDAPLRVVLFTDYQCPDCFRVEQQVERALTRSDVAVVVKHFPLCNDCNSGMSSSMHPDACRRAALAEAAAEIGGIESFAKAHRALFSVQPNPTLDPVDAIVRATGLDRATLEATARRPDIEARVKADVADAIALGVTFTPMVFVNGREWKWYVVGGSLDQLVARVAAMAEAAVQPPDAPAKLVDDWRVTSRMPKLVEPISVGRMLIDNEEGPEVRVWADVRLPGARVLAAALDQLAVDGLKFRVRLLQFPASEQCNPGSGFKGGDARSCLAAAALVAAGDIGGDQAFRVMYAWLVEHGADVDMAALLTQAEAQKLDRAKFQSAFSTGDALAKARAEADLLNGATKVLQIPTIVVEGRIIPRWTHPGADTAAVLRGVIEAATVRDAK